MTGDADSVVPPLGISGWTAVRVSAGPARRCEQPTPNYSVLVPLDSSSDQFGATLFVFVPDSDEAHVPGIEAAIRAVAAEEQAEVGVGISGEGRGGDALVVAAVVYTAATVGLVIKQSIEAVVAGAGVFMRLVHRLRTRDDTKAMVYSYEGLRLLCIADVVRRSPQVSPRDIYLEYESGIPDQPDGHIVDGRDVFIFIFAGYGYQWVYVVTATGHVQVLQAIEYLEYKYEHHIGDG